MAHPFFDEVGYPWSRRDAVEAHQKLLLVINDPKEFQLVYSQCGPGLTPLTPGLAAHLAWKEILDNLTKAKFLPKLCEIVLANNNWVTAHPSILAIQSATYLIDVVASDLIASDLIFLDRKELRPRLEKLAPSGSPATVLLVRGLSGSGKTWTERLVTAWLTAEHGLPPLFLFSGLVATVDDVVEQLFAFLEEPTAIPPRTESEEAWYRKVCLHLQTHAQKKNRIFWVIVDDLGEYETGPRMAPEIRGFFDQFALQMGNPAFRRWFRLVLLDYPLGAVPTKWRQHWIEEIPQEIDVNADRITEFLLARAAHAKKQLGEDEAREMAKDIIVTVEALIAQNVNADPEAPPPPPRLQRIHDALVGVLETL